jgi:hypothetical protein
MFRLDAAFEVFDNQALVPGLHHGMRLEANKDESATY